MRLLLCCVRVFTVIKCCASCGFCTCKCFWSQMLLQSHYMFGSLGNFLRSCITWFQNQSLSLYACAGWTHAYIGCTLNNTPIRLYAAQCVRQPSQTFLPTLAEAGPRLPHIPDRQRWRKRARLTATRCPAPAPPIESWRRARRGAAGRSFWTFWRGTCWWSWRCLACWWALGSGWWSAAWISARRRWSTSPSPVRCCCACWRWSSCRWWSVASSPAPPASTPAPWANWGASPSPISWGPRWSRRGSGWPWPS